MVNADRRVALCAVSVLVVVLVTACGGRTILHGGKYRKVSATKSPSKGPQRNVGVWFVKSSPSGDAHLVAVDRPINGKEKLAVAVKELLDGPTEAEDKAGLGTEIPRGTVLIGIKRVDGNVELNLSKRFATPGGTSSFETRLEQLRRTVASANIDAPVFLDVEGKRLNVSEGEGIEVKQPINR